LLNTASARRGFVPSRWGVGIGNALHAGQVIVADGTPAAARRLERVLTTTLASV